MRKFQMSNGNPNKSSKIKKVLKYLVFTLALLVVSVLGPMLFAFLLKKTSFLSFIPFSAEEWFAFWPGYLSLLASIFLDVFAIFFSFYIYTDELVRSKMGTISIDKVYVSKLSDDGKNLHSKIRFIDSNPLLSYNHQIELVQMNAYFCTSNDVFNNEKLFEEEFHVKKEYCKKMLPIIIKNDANEKGQNNNTRITPMFCNNELRFDIKFILTKEKPYKDYCVDFDKRDSLSKDIWKDCDTNTLVNKMLIVEFSYRIHNENKLFNIPILNELYKNYLSRKTTLQYNRIHFMFNELEYSNSKNQQELSYTACSNVRNIIKNR